MTALPEHLRICEDYDSDASELFLNNHFSRTFQFTIQQNGYIGYAVQDESASQEDLIGMRKKKGIPPRVDFGICLHHSRDRIMLIEGKRLHDPTDRQYVSGRTGGIARFKTEQHGADVEISCMVGYVQTNTFAFWHEKINGWIGREVASETPFWNANDYLHPVTEKTLHLCRCTSQHRRATKDSILLHHFWVKVA